MASSPLQSEGRKHKPAAKPALLKGFGDSGGVCRLTGKGEEGLPPHAATQQAEVDLWPIRLLEPGKQGQQIFHRHPRAEVLQIQHLWAKDESSQHRPGLPLSSAE